MLGHRFCYGAAAVFVAAAGGLWYSLLFNPEDGRARSSQLAQEINQRHEQNRQIEIEVEQMRALIRAIKTEPRRLQTIARHRLQMIKENEIFVLPTENN